MTTGTLTSTDRTITNSFNGEFDELPKPINYNGAGMISPKDWSLTVTTRITTRAGEDEATTYTSYALNLRAYNKYTSFAGNFGFPYEGKIASYDYGHGAAGFIYKLPAEILEVISDLTGYPLATLKAETDA